MGASTGRRQLHHSGEQWQPSNEDPCKHGVDCQFRLFVAPRKIDMVHGGLVPPLATVNGGACVTP